MQVCILSLFLSLSSSNEGTIPPIKSPLEKNDDVKKLFSICCPVIRVTVGVALLFIIRKKRKEKRLKRLRGEEERSEERGRGEKERRDKGVRDGLSGMEGDERQGLTH